MPKCDPSRSHKCRASAIKATVALALAGCAGPAYFRPSESATAISPQGFAAAQYAVLIGGNAVGETKVWSSGAFREKSEEGARTVVRVSFALENNGQQPMWLDVGGIELDSATADGQVLAPVRPMRVSGTPDVAPGGDGEVQASFELPADVKPGKIDSFRVRWTVRTPEGEYAQRTPFLEQKPAPASPAPFWYSPFYDPFLYPSPFDNRLVVTHPRVYVDPRGR
jgi:hypothetical protein